MTAGHALTTARELAEHAQEMEGTARGFEPHAWQEHMEDFLIDVLGDEFPASSEGQGEGEGGGESEDPREQDEEFSPCAEP
eukprot:15450957-Alexandrium_andersonii.AAC.1